MYVLKRLTLRDLRSRFNWKRHAVALLAAVAVGGGVMAFAWGANPPKASSPSVTLRGANLAGASFDGADLSNVDFTGANLNGANFTNTTLTGVVWRNTICPDGTNSDADGGTCLGHLGG